MTTLMVVTDVSSWFYGQVPLHRHAVQSCSCVLICFLRLNLQSTPVPTTASVFSTQLIFDKVDLFNL